MSRSTRMVGQDRNPAPVKKVELNEKNIVVRLIAAIVLLVIGAVGISYGVSQLTSQTTGWLTVTADDATKGNCSDDFVFLYDMGDGDVAERRAIMKLYSAATSDAYKYFSADEEFSGINNVYAINSSPNTEIQVPVELYRAFQMLEEYGAEDLYLGPVYNYLNGAFMSSTDDEAKEYDPYLNDQVKTYFEEVISYTKDRDAISLELLADNKVILHVSEEYASYAKENGIQTFIDFFWMKNAFIIDMMADRLITAGYTNGILSSYDGFQRVLYDSSDEFATNFYDTGLGATVVAGTMKTYGRNNMVTYRNFVLSPSKDLSHYYVYEDGTTINSYVDPEDGMYKCANNCLMAYAKDLTCAEIMLELRSVYIAADLDTQAIQKLTTEGINSVYTKGSVIYYNDSKLKLDSLYEGYSASFIN